VVGEHCRHIQAVWVQQPLEFEAVHHGGNLGSQSVAVNVEADLAGVDPGAQGGGDDGPPPGQRSWNQAQTDAGR
jgi:hypothetical protein